MKSFSSGARPLAERVLPISCEGMFAEGGRVPFFPKVVPPALFCLSMQRVNPCQEGGKNLVLVSSACQASSGTTHYEFSEPMLSPLALLFQGLSREAVKRLRFKPGILFIDGSVCVACSGTKAYGG